MHFCRTGALDFLELFMDAAPKQVMQNHLEGALQHFVELLSPTRRSNSVSAHSVTSMLKVIASAPVIKPHADNEI